MNVHSDNSSLDGMATVPRYVARAVELGMPALALTDHGNIAGSHEFYSECRRAEIEPILGSEFYFVRDTETVKDDKTAERFHITFLAQDEAGFEILTALSTASHRNYYYKPLIDVKMLEALDKKDRKKLVVLSGCAGSIVSRSLLGGIEDDAHEWLNWWKKTFPQFYIELMHHDTDFDKKLNGKLLKAAKRHDLPWVITNDPHYVLKEEACHHDALLAIQTAARLDDESRFRFDGEGYHLRSGKEMRKVFERRYGEAVWKPGAANTIAIAKTCKTRIKAWDARSWHIPKFPGVENADRALRLMAEEGLKTRGLDKSKKYVKRVKHELAEFKRVGMANFLLINADICAEARRRGIRMGPGRGSVCGTLVGYLIGIHKIDPIRYTLLFERFLNPERPKLPDIDLDFPPSRRKEMFDYAEEKYGKDNVMRVGAYQRAWFKKTFKSLAMTYGLDFQTANKLSKSIVEDEEGNGWFATNKGAVSIEQVYPDLYASLMALKGLKTGIARHAAGVIIFDPDDPIRNLVPEMRIADEDGKKKTIDYVSQFNLEAAGDIGLLKQDFLGLRTLDTIQVCLDLIKERHGIDIEPDDWVPGEEKGDDKVWRLLRQGHTAGIFQMEGGANRRGIQQIKCGEFEDIVSCTSLYRAGPLIAGADKRFLKNKKDKKIRVAHKTLEPFMRQSWGEMIYQEQMFQMLNEAAGLSWAQVDDVKTAMARKDPAKMAAMKEATVEGFQKVSGMSAEKAEKIWEMIQAQAAYLFNRSHAVAYSMLTYQTARLRVFYPLEFFAALMRTVTGSSDTIKEKRESYLSEAIHLEFKIQPPDVNVSDDGFMPNGKDELLFGLTDVKGVGDVAVRKLIEYRERKLKEAKRRGKPLKRAFSKPEEVLLAVNNKGVYAALCAAGALRSLGVDPDTEKQEELLRWQFEDRLKEYREKYAKRISLPDPSKGGRCSILGEIRKIEDRRTKKGDPYKTWTLRHAPGEEYKVSVWQSAEELFPLLAGSIVIVKGTYSPAYHNIGVSDSDDVTIVRRITKRTVEKAKKESAA